MSGDPTPGTRSASPARHALLWASAAALLVVAVAITGVALVAAVGSRGDDASWTRWSQVGEAFGAVNSAVAGMALAAVVITFLTQYRELRAQREELVLQRRTLEKAESALRRSAEVDLRNLHVDLIRMAIDDPVLAATWPKHPGMDAQTQRQHLYVNLILQNAWLHHTLGLSTKAELQNSLRHLFTSPAVREYWAATAPSRANTYVAGSEEATLAAAADEIFREYEAVLLSADDRSHPTAGGGRPARRHREAGHGQDLTAA